MGNTAMIAVPGASNSSGARWRDNHKLMHTPSENVPPFVGAKTKTKHTDRPR